jgi:plasmid maintenance system antidote protein VapI
MGVCFRFENGDVFDVEIVDYHALRLARYFGTDAQSWLNLQMSYDLKIAEAELKDKIEREVERMAA